MHLVTTQRLSLVPKVKVCATPHHPAQVKVPGLRGFGFRTFWEHIILNIVFWTTSIWLYSDSRTEQVCESVFVLKRIKTDTQISLSLQRSDRAMFTFLDITSKTHVSPPCRVTWYYSKPVGHDDFAYTHTGSKIDVKRHLFEEDGGCFYDIDQNWVVGLLASCLWRR